MTSTTWRRHTLGIVLLAAATASTTTLESCGSSDTLYGSISTSNSLQFSSVVVGVQGTTLIVDYQTSDGETPAKLAIDTNGLTLGNNVTLDGNNFLTNVTLTRVMSESNDTFPPVVRGSIDFGSYATSPGATLSGHFAITFDTGDLLEGDFSGSLVNDNSASAQIMLPSDTPAGRFDATDAGSGAISLRRNPTSIPRVRHAPYPDRLALAGLSVFHSPPGAPHRRS